jgi:hypothetical protein
VARFNNPGIGLIRILLSVPVQLCKPLGKLGFPIVHASLHPCNGYLFPYPQMGDQILDRPMEVKARGSDLLLAQVVEQFLQAIQLLFQRSQDVFFYVRDRSSTWLLGGVLREHPKLASLTDLWWNVPQTDSAVQTATASQSRPMSKELISMDVHAAAGEGWATLRQTSHQLLPSTRVNLHVIAQHQLLEAEMKVRLLVYPTLRRAPPRILWRRDCCGTSRQAPVPAPGSVSWPRPEAALDQSVEAMLAQAALDLSSLSEGLGVCAQRRNASAVSFLNQSAAVFLREGPSRPCQSVAEGLTVKDSAVAGGRGQNVGGQWLGQAKPDLDCQKAQVSRT